MSADRRSSGTAGTPGVAGESSSLSASSPETDLAILGYAQVLVVIDQLVAQRATSAGASTAALESTAEGFATRTRRTAADLAPYFITPPNAQDVALAVSRVQSGARRLRRTMMAHANVDDAADHVAATVAAQVPKMRVFDNLGVVLGAVNEDGLRRLQSDARVQEVHAAPQLSFIRPTKRAAARKGPGVTYGLSLLGVPDLWAADFTGKGILVGHLDTGVDASHPALKGAVAAFAEFDFLGKEIPNAKARDTDEHGTHTAGTIAGRKVGSSRFGVAPGARLASAIVIEGGNVVARVLGGMNWVVGQHARILSMSLGLRGYNAAFLALVKILRARGVLPVFAVGNEGPGTSRSPGNYAECLSIGACDSAKGVADFSSSQTFARPKDPIVPDVVGPGVDVLSSVPSGKYAQMSGTSMATPHIAGLAALLMEAAPHASIDDVERAILDSASLAPGMLPDRAGHGLPNGPAAYKLLTGKVLPGGPGGGAKRPERAKKRSKSRHSKAAKRVSARK